MTRDRRGFALIAAIWLMVALSALGLEVALLARQRRLAAANAVEGAAAHAAAEAGLEHARARLTRRLAGEPTPGRRFDRRGGGASNPSPEAFGSSDPWRALFKVLPDTFALDGQRYAVRLDDANARVNLNVASESQLRRLFAAIHVDAGKAGQLTQAIADWRDSDDLARAQGAERMDYLAAGLPFLPRNAPLVRVDELRDLFGMTAAIFSAVSPHVTVRGNGQVNVNTAERAVLRSLPGVSEEAAVAALRLRASGVVISSLEQLATALSPGARNQLLDATAELLPLVTFETREIEVTSEGWLAGSPSRARVSGLFVRGGGAIFFLGKRTE